MNNDTELSFSFNLEEVETIRAALGQMPHDDVNVIIHKIYQTVHSHVFDEIDSPIQVIEAPKPKTAAAKKRRVKRPAKKPVERTGEAPYGLKKDGTPKKRPGRPAK